MTTPTDTPTDTTDTPTETPRVYRVEDLDLELRPYDPEVLPLGLDNRHMAIFLAGEHIGGISVPDGWPFGTVYQLNLGRKAVNTTIFPDYGTYGESRFAENFLTQALDYIAGDVRAYLLRRGGDR